MSPKTRSQRLGCFASTLAIFIALICFASVIGLAVGAEAFSRKLQPGEFTRVLKKIQSGPPLETLSDLSFARYVYEGRIHTLRSFSFMGIFYFRCACLLVPFGVLLALVTPASLAKPVERWSTAACFGFIGILGALQWATPRLILTSFPQMPIEWSPREAMAIVASAADWQWRVFIAFGVVAGGVALSLLAAMGSALALLHRMRRA